MKSLFKCLVPIFLLTYTPGECGIFIPEEIPSFLSLIYSIVPPIKVGKDSRFGAGFRIGPNADFQFLVELGPQTNTLPLGVNPNEVNDALPGRRQVTENDLDPAIEKRLQKQPPLPSNWENNNLSQLPKKQKEINQTTNKKYTVDLVNNIDNSILSNELSESSARAKLYNVDSKLEESTRKIVRLPDSIVLPSTDSNKKLPSDKNNKINSSNVLDENETVVNRNKTSNNSQINSIKNKINKQHADSVSIDLKANQIIENTIKNNTSQIVTKKKNDNNKQSNDKRPRLIRDWFVNLFDNFRRQTTGGGTGFST